MRITFLALLTLLAALPARADMNISLTADGGTESTAYAVLRYGRGSMLLDSATPSGTPDFGSGTLTVYVKRRDGEWSPWVAYTSESEMPSNPLMFNFGRDDVELYVALSSSTDPDLYVEIVEAKNR